MKKYTAIIILIICLVLTGFFIRNSVNKINEDNILSFKTEIKVTPTPLRLPYGTINQIDYGKDKYFVFWVKLPLTAKIFLIPNFKERIIGEKLAEDNKCDLGINGGFYLGNEKPLGLFVARGNTYGKQVNSNIANAFVWMDKAGDLRFVKNPPQNFEFTDFIFQTGPMFAPSNNQLKLIKDEKARRSLLGKDVQGKLYLINITSDNLVGGPHLSDIPIIFWQMKMKNILNIEELINLDGGSASFFYSKDSLGSLTLSSWSVIGSLLCVKLPD